MATLFTVADTVFDSATVEVRVVVVTPLALVTAGCENVLPVPETAITTVAPATGLPNPSFAVTVMVEPAPPAVMGEVAATVVWLAETDPAVMLKALLVAAASVPDRPLKTYPVPALLTFNDACVATPAVNASMLSPASAAPVGLVLKRIVSLPANPVTVLLRPSWTATTTAGAMVAPAVALDGWTVKARCVAFPGVTLNAELVAAVIAEPDLALRVNPVPVLSIERPGKLATPETATTMAVPESVPVPALFAMVTVSVPANPVATLPNWSFAVTCTAPRGPADVSLTGWPVNASWLAAAGFTTTVAVCVIPTLLAVAETSLDSATVEESVVVKTPFTLAVPVRAPVVLPVPPIVTDTEALGTGFPLASFAVTVMVLWLAPLEAVMGDEAVTVD